MKTTKLLTLICAIWLNSVFGQGKIENVDSHTIEKSYLELSRIEVIPIKDTKTNRQYELYVKLPEGYSENNDIQYPVIYYTDAMWHVEILSGATEYIMEETILVGISWQKDIEEDVKQKYGAHASRFVDYSFWKTTNPKHPLLQFGQASNHLTFIRNDVFNYIEQNYRARPNDRSYFGYSLSGIFGAYILVTQPDTFKNYILGSPSVNLLTEEKHKIEFTNKKLNANVFISHGTLEKNLHESISEFVTLLKNRNDNSLSIEHVEIEGSHQTAFPMTGVRSIQWLSKMNNFLALEDRYLGQKLPGLVPEPFALDIISTENWEVSGVFTPDMKEFYFIREVTDTIGNKKQEFVVFQYINNKWQESIISPRVGQPFISPDGKTMHLGKRYKERTETGWSEIKNLGSPFEEIQIMRLTASSKGTYVFDEVGMPNGDGVIRYSRLIDGKREEPKPFGKVINTGKMNAHPFIAPDESYLIWDGRRKNGYGSSDIYISFKQQDGTWGEAINLGDKINTEAWEAGARVTPDGKYLFFNRNMGSSKYENVDIFWVSAQVIENLRPKKE
jgi:predicted alpha/beta superfamily hydrolase